MAKSKHQSLSVGEATARFIDKLVDRFMPDEALYPNRSTKVFCAFMGGVTFIILQIRHYDALDQLETVVRDTELLRYGFLFYMISFQFSMILFYCWLISHMSEKIGRTRAYFLGLLLPTISIKLPDVLEIFKVPTSS